jgi:hypothetical protein
MAYDFFTRSVWTADKIERLRILWAKGHTAAECAAAIGVGRNAAIGKINRLGLCRKKCPRTGQAIRNKTTSPWTQARMDRMREMWLTNTAAEIAKVLGVTESAVQRKAHNMRLPNKNKIASVRSALARRAWTSRPVGRPPTSRAREPLPAPNMKPVTLWERTGCAFPVNDGGPFLFCNCSTEGGAYCGFHAQIMVKS